MKKLLSIFAISGILASTTPTITACKSKPKSKSMPLIPCVPSTSKPKPEPKPVITKFDLTKVNVTGIEVTKATRSFNLQINTNRAYNKIVNTIVAAYNSAFTFKGKHLKTTDFRYAPTTDDTHSWAIQIINGNNNAFATLKNNANIFTTQPTTEVLLPNNALKVKIVTTNNNVKEKKATAHIYLNKFIYSEKNINQGTVITKQGGGLPTAAKLATAMDVTHEAGIAVDTNTTGRNIKTNIKEITDQAKARVSRKVLRALNQQLITETETLKKWGILNPQELANTEEINFRAVRIVNIYTLNLRTNEVNRLNDAATPLLIGNKVYVQLLNLGLNSYLGALNSYLYLKIGTIRQ